MSEPPAIRQLSEALANQIAAGEVIERPAAVVKELVENSLDAGATRVVVRAEDGGRRLIEVEDDGHGIRASELRLALARHATSKLRSTEDLFAIATLGFRGEALPSIAAVSEFSIASRPATATQGCRISLGSDGALSQEEPCAMAPGTRVTVRNLFWNVPVRLKFLKSEAAESGHLTEQVIRLALSHPQVGFQLISAGRMLLDLAPGQILTQRVRELFGREFSAGLLAVASSRDQLQVAGFVAHPREAKPTARRQYCFLNGRWVRDKLLLAAVREGFKGYLEPRLHGAVILHLDCDPSQVDVNVHPTKSEVRFRREGEVFALVQQAVASTLREHSGDFSLLTPADAARHAGDPILRSAPLTLAPALGAQLAGAFQERYLPHLPEVARPAEPPPRLREGAPAAAGLASSDLDQGRPGSPLTAAPRPPPMPAPLSLPRGVRRVMQLNRMFLLIETDQGIRLVDQHALHEKALFLTLDPALGEVVSGGSQQLLVPRSIALSAAEVAALEPLLADLAAHGIQAEVFGPTTVLVRACPPRLRRLNWANFFGELAASGSRERALGTVAERIRHSAACHGAVKAGQDLSAEEQLELVSALYRLEGMEHCPHGRPTTLDLPWPELARRFQR